MLVDADMAVKMAQLQYTFGLYAAISLTVGFVIYILIAAWRNRE